MNERRVPPRRTSSPSPTARPRVTLNAPPRPIESPYAHVDACETCGRESCPGDCRAVDGAPADDAVRRATFTIARNGRRIDTSALAHKSRATEPRPATNATKREAAPTSGATAKPAHEPAHVKIAAGIAAHLSDAVDVSAEGRAMLESGGPRYVVRGIVPDYGMLGFLAAYAKVGKTSFGIALAAAVATGEPFLERETQRRRVLVVLAEDPPEYSAYLARHLTLPAGALSFYRRPLGLEPATLEALVTIIKEHGFGLLVISTWQAVVRGVVRDENDNAQIAHVVENVKAAARASGVPWLIDSHSGKGEDQSDDADPMLAMRGASAAMGAADFVLSLRRARGEIFGSSRRLSGLGRFVDLPLISITRDDTSGAYTVAATAQKNAMAESDWTLLESVALSETPQTINELCKAVGLVGPNGRVCDRHRNRVRAALADRPTVGRVEVVRNHAKAWAYQRLENATNTPTPGDGGVGVV